MTRPRGRRPLGRRGYILVETTIVYVILSLAMTALLPLFILCFRASKSTAHIASATQLAQALLEEVRVRRWDEETPRPARLVALPSRQPGPDAGEAPSDKRTFDDIDDFHLWAEIPVLDPGMEPVPSLEAFSRSVTVDYVLPDAPDQASEEPSDLKRVTACAQWRKSRPICLSTLFANR